MFLWVTDFYSLEKIISVSLQIVLLYLKKKQLHRERERGRAKGREDGERAWRGIFLLGGGQGSQDWTWIAVGLYILRPRLQEESWNASVRRAEFDLRRYTQILSDLKTQHTGQT